MINKNFRDCRSHFDSSLPHVILHIKKKWMVFNLHIIEGKIFEFREIARREEFLHAHLARS